MASFQIEIKFPVRLYKDLMSQAIKDGKSVNELVVMLLEKSVRDEKHKPILYQQLRSEDWEGGP